MEQFEKFDKWISNAKRRAKDYELVYPYNDTYIMTMEDCVEDICNLEILIWENGKLNFQYSWSKGEKLQDKEKIMFVSKKQKKMMLCVKDKNLYSFGNGVDKKREENQEIFIYRKGTETSSLIFASSQRGKIEQLNDIHLDENRIDATEIVIKQMVKDLALKQKEEEDATYEEKC